MDVIALGLMALGTIVFVAVGVEYASHKVPMIILFGFGVLIVDAAICVAWVSKVQTDAAQAAKEKLPEARPTGSISPSFPSTPEPSDSAAVPPKSVTAPHSELNPTSPKQSASPGGPQMPSDKPKDKAPTPSLTDNSIKNSPIVNSPGAVQAPGGTVIKTDIPEPKVDVKQLAANEPFNGQYRSRALMIIEAKVPISNLFVRVNAATIVSLDAIPQRTGMSMTGHSGVRDGWAFTNLQNAYGSYEIVVLTKAPASLEVIYDFK